MTEASELFELKVIVEADGWRDLSGLMAAVDDALEPHRLTSERGRRWSVVAARLPADHARELLWFIDECNDLEPTEAPADRMSA